MALQKEDFNGLVTIENCTEDERSWHFLRLGEETILLANWYRPGATIHDGFRRLYEETQKYYEGVSGIVVAGDLNIHHRRSVS